MSSKSKIEPPQAPSRIVLNHDLSALRALLQDYAGVQIDHPAEVLAEVVEQFRVAHGFRSAAELIARIQAYPNECQLLLESLLPVDTGFFRPAEIFATLQKDVLPEITGRNDGETLRPLRMWSAGCSTGEEAYSIAISVCETLAGEHRSWKVHIVGGDVRRNALKFAERGLYPAAAGLCIPNALVGRYFSRVGDHLLVKPRVRDLVTFTPMNLVENAFIGRFHCIFCLDVLPHLSASGKAAAWLRLQLALEPGGYIFLGEHDQLPTGVSLLRHSASIYQRPFAVAAGAGK
jgi:two-component system, chemotaxis family, CheB/CheR fusion protein